MFNFLHNQKEDALKYFSICIPAESADHGQHDRPEQLRGQRGVGPGGGQVSCDWWTPCSPLIGGGQGGQECRLLLVLRGALP